MRVLFGIAKWKDVGRGRRDRHSFREPVPTLVAMKDEKKIPAIISCSDRLTLHFSNFRSVVNTDGIFHV